MSMRQSAGPPAASGSARLSWFLLGGFATIAVLGLGAVVAWSMITGTALNRQAAQSTLTSDAAPDAVRVEGSVAGVELTGAETDAVTGDLQLSWYGDLQPAVETAWEERTWVVDLGCRYPSIAWWFAPGPGCGVDYQAVLPRAADADVRLTSGTVVLERTTGTASLQTTSGTIEARAVAGDLTASTESGNVLASALRSATVSAETTTGSTSLEFAESPARVEAEATSGSIEVLVPRGEDYRVLTGSSSGMIDVGVATDPEAEAVIDLRTTTGSITVDYSD